MTVHVPDDLDELLSPEWLSGALQPRFPGLQVTAVELGRVIRRVSTVAYFEIDCDGGVPDGLSPQMVVKGYFDASPDVVRYVGAGEAYFYRELAAATGVRSLRSVYADIDPVTLHGVVITENAAVAGGVFLDALSEYTPDTVAESLEQFAKLHAATWSNPTYANVAALAPRFQRLAMTRGVDVITNNVEGPLGDRIPAGARDARRLHTAYPIVVAASAEASPWTVIHGDAHVGNILLDNDGKPALVDWQLVQRGAWYMDVGYHLGSALSVEDRRSHEDDLLRHYLDRLAAGGVAVPTMDHARSLIGRGMIHGYFLWAITQMVDAAVISTLLERLGAAVADHDAFDAVDSLR